MPGINMEMGWDGKGGLMLGAWADGSGEKEQLYSMYSGRIERLWLWLCWEHGNMGNMGMGIDGIYQPCHLLIVSS